MRPSSALAAIATAIGCAVAFAPAASAQDPIPIGPGQFFQGQVKGLHSGAVIYVVCPGPVTPGELGHPVSGQPVQVVPGSASTIGGYTGSLGTSVVASFGPSTTTAPQALTFTSYYALQDIPTTFWLPCGGTGVIPFTPQPTSPTAVTDHVSVTYENIAV
jgi:hypothetical protein